MNLDVIAAGLLGLCLGIWLGGLRVTKRHEWADLERRRREHQREREMRP